MGRRVFFNKNTSGDNRIWIKYAAKWGVQIAGMIFQTVSRAP